MTIDAHLHEGFGYYAALETNCIQTRHGPWSPTGSNFSLPCDAVMHSGSSYYDALTASEGYSMILFNDIVLRSSYPITFPGFQAVHTHLSNGIVFYIGVKIIWPIVNSLKSAMLTSYGLRHLLNSDGIMVLKFNMHIA